jgi:seryl-tRNA synthetase
MTFYSVTREQYDENGELCQRHLEHFEDPYRLSMWLQTECGLPTQAHEAYRHFQLHDQPFHIVLKSIHIAIKKESTTMSYHSDVELIRMEITDIKTNLRTLNVMLHDIMRRVDTLEQQHRHTKKEEDDNAEVGRR